MTYETTYLPQADWGQSRAPAFIGGAIVGLILVALAYGVDIPQPDHDWQGKVASHALPR